MITRLEYGVMLPDDCQNPYFIIYSPCLDPVPVYHPEDA